MSPDAETDLNRLAELSTEVAADYVDETAADWEGSPFNWIRQLPSSRTKGKVGESLVKAWAVSEGIEVDPAKSSDHDMILDGTLIEVKFSLRWAGGTFVFQQIRDQDYEVAALLGLEPRAARLWFVPKAILREKATSQHGGQAGRDTKWLRFSAVDSPDWLDKWGGSLQSAKRALEKARRTVGK
jgi:hypothetical protein